MTNYPLLKRLSDLRTIQSLAFRGSQLELQWVAEDGRCYELGIPFLEACKLVKYLQDAFRKAGRTRFSRGSRLTSASRSKEETTRLSRVTQFQGISVSGAVTNLQWVSASGEWHELRLPLETAPALLDEIEETLPLDRKPADNITVEFHKRIPINDLADLWRVAYRADRYLKELTNELLNQRVADILANGMRRDDDGKLRPIWRIDENERYKPDRDIDWMRLLTDAHTELMIRGQPPTKIEVQFPRRLEDETWCKRPDLVEKSSKLLGSYARPTMLFKYGKREWNKSILNTGRIRLTPASNYNDAPLNAAIRDDELGLSWADEKNIFRTFQVDDYYVFCVSGVYDYRLYRDFDESDSCLVIRDAEEFNERIREATKLNLEAKVMGVISAPVIYVDQFRTEKPELAREVYFTKHFRYAYQYEFRFVWPPRGNLPLATIELDLGDLSALAEVIVRDHA
jgi:hypothetical protein